MGAFYSKQSKLKMGNGPIAGVLPEGRRNLAFGLFYVGYGLGWLVGSVTMGLLYERSLPLLIAFSIVAQLAMP